jgi:hypothetical protein
MGQILRMQVNIGKIINNQDAITKTVHSSIHLIIGVWLLVIAIEAL